MKIVSLKFENTDVLDYLIQQVEKKLQNSLRKKIFLALNSFLVQESVENNKMVKNLKWPVFEFKISIPGTKKLLRIIFYYQKWKLILLSWYIIKPENYGDKKNISMIQTEYIKEIEKAKNVYQDYTWSQNLNYFPITFK